MTKPSDVTRMLIFDKYDQKQPVHELSTHPTKTKKHRTKFTAMHFLMTYFHKIGTGSTFYKTLQLNCKVPLL